MFRHSRKKDNAYWDSVMKIRLAQRMIEPTSNYLFCGVSRLEFSVKCVNGGDYRQLGEVFSSATIGKICILCWNGSVTFSSLVKPHYIGNSDWELVSYNGNLTPLTDLLSATSELSISDDPKLKEIVSECRFLLSGWDSRYQFKKLLSRYGKEEDIAIAEAEMNVLNSWESASDVAEDAADAAIEMLKRVRLIASLELPRPNWRQRMQTEPNFDVWFASQMS